MKSFTHDIVCHLLDLHALEDQLAVRGNSGSSEERSDAESLIKSVRAKLPVGVLLLHDKMRARGKRSVAGVRCGVCSGCHLALGVGNVAAVRAKELRRCGNCGRYMYTLWKRVIRRCRPR